MLHDQRRARCIAPHSNALRRNRESTPGDIYAVTTSALSRRRYFDGFYRGRCVVDALRRAEARGQARTLAFVVMPDRLHWLLRLGTEAQLAKVVARVKRESSASLNASDEQVGRRIWQPGYYEHHAHSDEDLYSQARYIVENPIRAGVVLEIGDYPLWDCVWL